MSPENASKLPQNTPRTSQIAPYHPKLSPDHTTMSPNHPKTFPNQNRSPMMIVTIITSSSGKDRTPSAKNSKYHQGTEVLFGMDQKFFFEKIEPSKHLNWVSNVDTNLLSLMWYFEKHGSSSLSKSMKTSFKSATTSFESSHSSWVQMTIKWFD